MNRFWETKTLAQLTEQEWESLCDGCARCCMIKLQDEDTQEVHYTAAVCDLLDLERCTCTQYPRRHALVADCVVLTPQAALDFSWLPTTCAYRRVAEGKPLMDWHPLLSGNSETVHEAGISVRDKVVHEGTVHEEELETMVINWVQQ